MSTQKSNRIAEIRKAKGLTQQELAEALGVHWITVSKLERGVMQLTSTWIEKIAAALKVDEVDLLAAKPKRLTYDVEAIIGDNGQIQRVKDEEREEIVEIEPAEEVYSFWASVQTDALYPAFQFNDIIRFVTLLEEEWADYDGKLAYVVLDNDQEGFGVFEAGSTEGLFDFMPLGSKRPIRNVRIKYLAVAREARFLRWKPIMNNIAK